MLPGGCLERAKDYMDPIKERHKRYADRRSNATVFDTFKRNMSAFEASSRMKGFRIAELVL